MVMGMQWLEFSKQGRKQRHPLKEENYWTSRHKVTFWGFLLSPPQFGTEFMAIHAGFLSSTPVWNPSNIFLNDFNA